MEKPNRDLLLSVSEVASDALGVSVDDLPSLANAVDPDALEALVSPAGDLHRDTVRVTFDYAGLEVVVQSGTIVYASPISESWDGSIRGPRFGR